MKCIQKEDVIGISTMTFTPTGEAFYMSSSSEMARVSMAAAYNLQPTGMRSCLMFALILKSSFLPNLK